MVLLKLLITINAQLSQVKEKSNNNIAIFDRLAIIILMRNFLLIFSSNRKTPLGNSYHYIRVLWQSHIELFYFSYNID